MQMNLVELISMQMYQLVTILQTILQTIKGIFEFKYNVA